MTHSSSTALTNYIANRPKSYGSNPHLFFEGGWDARQAEVDALTARLTRAEAPRAFPTHYEMRSSGWSGAIV